MTRRDQLLKARDELCGMIADAHVAQRKGGDLALRLKRDFERVEQILRTLEVTNEANGVLPPQRKDTAK